MDLKILTLVGTRPEIIKLSRVIFELEAHTNHILVHSGQNYDYELNQVFFQDLGLRKPDYFLDIGGESAAKAVGYVISRLDDVLDKEKPDAMLLLGDTNSCLGAIAAKRRKIPLFHMEAGNRCFDQRVPEEINRKIIDHISDINMTYTEHARRYLLLEGLRPETVIKTGSPMKEVLNCYRSAIDASDVLDRMQLMPGGYFVVSAHREENIDNEVNFKNFLDTLATMAQKYDRAIIVSTHPRTRKRMESSGIGDVDRRVHFMRPLGFLDYVKLQLNAFCVVSDSGTITEESSILNFPAVTIRQAHERPEGMDEGTLIMCGLQPESVIQAIDVVTGQAHAGKRVFRIVPDYDVDNVSQKVLRIIMSYIDYINRTVWFR